MLHRANHLLWSAAVEDRAFVRGLQWEREGL